MLCVFLLNSSSEGATKQPVMPVTEVARDPG